MRLPIFLTILLVLLASPLTAQIDIGIKGGLNFADLRPAPTYLGEGPRTGFAAGVYLDINIIELVSIQPEVLFSTKGYSAEHHFTQFGYPNDSKQTFINSYIELPILVKYAVPLPIFSPCLYAGPDVGFLVGAILKTHLSGTAPVDPFFTTFAPYSFSSEDNLLYHTMRIDYGLAVGGSVHFFVARIDARYTIGLKRVTDDRPDNFNRVWSLMLELPIF